MKRSWVLDPVEVSHNCSVRSLPLKLENVNLASNSKQDGLSGVDFKSFEPMTYDLSTLIHRFIQDISTLLLEIPSPCT